MRVFTDEVKAVRTPPEEKGPSNLRPRLKGFAVGVVTCAHGVLDKSFSLFFSPSILYILSICHLADRSIICDDISV